MNGEQGFFGNRKLGEPRPYVKALAFVDFEPSIRISLGYVLGRLDWCLQEPAHLEALHATYLHARISSNEVREVFRLFWGLIPILFASGVIEVRKQSKQDLRLVALFNCFLQGHFRAGPCLCSDASGVLLKYYFEMGNRHFEISASKDKKIRYKRWYHYFILEAPFGDHPVITMAVPFNPYEHPSPTWDVFLFPGVPSDARAFRTPMALLSVKNPRFTKHVAQKREEHRYVISKSRAEGIFIV